MRKNLSHRAWAVGSAFKCIQLQRLEWSVASRLPARQKAPLRQKIHPPLILNEPPPLLNSIQLQRLESPAISLSHSKQKALQGRELEVSCDSKRAASTFKLASLIQIVLLVLRSCVLLGGLLVLVLRREFDRFRISVLRRGSERRGQLVDHKLVSLRFRRAG